MYRFANVASNSTSDRSAKRMRIGDASHLQTIGLCACADANVLSIVRHGQPNTSGSEARPRSTTLAVDYGLRRGVLSPMETLAQSVSTIAPSTTPVATIPLVCALAGNGTWLAYVLATAAILLVAWCVSRFARYSSSPGSLYNYAYTILPPWMAAAAGWSLLLAYIATGSSVIGGFYHYANVLLRDATGHVTSTAFLALLVTAISMWIAWRDVKISARMMLWIEAASLLVILAVVVLVLARHGLHGDWDQLRLRGMTGSGLRLGLVLALFSFVGFESATTLGSEARDPLRDDSSRRDSKLHHRRSLLHCLRLYGSARLSRRRPGSRREPDSHACSRSSGRRARYSDC